LRKKSSYVVFVAAELAAEAILAGLGRHACALREGFEVLRKSRSEKLNRVGTRPGLGIYV